MQESQSEGDYYDNSVAHRSRGWDLDQNNSEDTIRHENYILQRSMTMSEARAMKK